MGMFDTTLFDRPIPYPSAGPKSARIRPKPSSAWRDHEASVFVKAQAMDRLIGVEQVGHIHFLTCLSFSNMFLRGHKRVYDPFYE